MSVNTRLMTADEFFNMPDDGQLHELIRGEVTTMSLPGGTHGKVVSKILRRIGNHVEAHSLGETYAESGFLIERRPDTVRGPDVAFVRKDRLAEILNPEKYVPFAPDLAVEVVSPNDVPVELAEKVGMWLEAGALMVWVVEPRDRTVTVHQAGVKNRTLTAEKTLKGGKVLPGFTCKVSDFFD